MAAGWLMSPWWRWTTAGRPEAGDRKSTRLNSSHLVISYAVSLDRKSTRLNSSHLVISYAVFCLKKKKKIKTTNLVTQYIVIKLYKASRVVLDSVKQRHTDYRHI